MSSGIDYKFDLAKYEVSFDPIKDLATAKSAKPSGTEYQFSNIDAMLLTLLVEKISGLTFKDFVEQEIWRAIGCLLYTSPSPRDLSTSRMPSSA